MANTVYLIVLGIALAYAVIFGVVAVLAWVAAPLPVY
jgi:hypothetical protein